LEQAAQGGGGVTLEVFKRHVDVALQVWFSRHGGVERIVGLDNLRGLFSVNSPFLGDKDGFCYKCSCL